MQRKHARDALGKACNRILEMFPYPDLSACWPAKEPYTGKSPKVLPGVLLRVLSEIRVLSGVLPRVLSELAIDLWACSAFWAFDCRDVLHRS